MLKSMSLVRERSTLALMRNSYPWEPYVQSMVDQIQSQTDGAPDQAQAIAQNVLNNASGLAQEDYDVVAAAANLTYSSTQSWYNYAQDYNCTSDYCNGYSRPENAMSLFAQQHQHGPSFWKGVAIDAIGCAAGAWAGGWVGCAVGGISASAMYVVAEM
jgi:hypothetical protein